MNSNDKQLTESHIFKFGSPENGILVNISNNKNYILFNVQDNSYFPPIIYEAFLSFRELKEKNEIFNNFKSTYQFVSFLESCQKKHNMKLNFDKKDSAFIIIKDSSFEKDLILEIQKKKNQQINQSNSNKIQIDNSFLISKLEQLEKEISSLKLEVQILKEKNQTLENKITLIQNTQIANSPHTEFQIKNINSSIINSPLKHSKNNSLLESQRTSIPIEKIKITESEIVKNSEIQLINSWIKPDTEIKYKLLFSTKINGDDSSIFHLLCDDNFPTLTIIKTKTGFRFGGYTTIPWKSDSLVFYKDNLAFLFSLDKKMKYLPENPDEAICCISGCGPTFGASDLTIRNECTKNCNSFCQGPQSYQMEKSELSGGVEKFVVDCYEVYLVEFGN